MKFVFSRGKIPAVSRSRITNARPANQNLPKAPTRTIWHGLFGGVNGRFSGGTSPAREENRLRWAGKLRGDVVAHYDPARY
jgi:hypothetical protein